MDTPIWSGDGKKEGEIPRVYNTYLNNSNHIYFCQSIPTILYRIAPMNKTMRRKQTKKKTRDIGLNNYKSGKWIIIKETRLEDPSGDILLDQSFWATFL